MDGVKSSVNTLEEIARSLKEFLKTIAYPSLWVICLIIVLVATAVIGFSKVLSLVTGAIKSKFPTEGQAGSGERSGGKK